MKIPAISIALISLALAGCAVSHPRPPAAVGVCEALRPSFPIGYHGGYHGIGGDSSDTVRRIREANARFAKACP